MPGSAGDWAVVGFSSDPIPDDPGVVAAQVEHIRGVAASLAAELQAMPTDGQVDAIRWESQDDGAPAEFKSIVKKLPRDLRLLHTRYQRVGEAMGTFEGELSRAKAQAQANLPLAVAAHRDILAAQNGVKQMQDFASQARHSAAVANAAAKPGTPPVAPAQWSGPDWPSQLGEAQRRFDNAQGQIQDAVRQFHRASATAASAVHSAGQDAIKNDDSFWGSIAHAVLSAAHWLSAHIPVRAISAILNKISAIVGIVALVFAFVPVIGDLVDVVLSAALITLALGVMACDVITQLNNAYEGTFSAKDFFTAMGLDVLNVALSSVGMRAALAARSAGQAAEAAAEETRTAEAALRSAKASSAVARHWSALQDRLVGFSTQGGRIRNWALDRVGFTAWAQRGASEARAALRSADDTEHLMAVRLAAKKAAQAAAEAGHRSAVLKGATVAGFGLAGVTGGTGAAEHSPNPAQWLESSGTELHDIWQWSDPSTGLESAGGRLQAHLATLPAPSR